MPLDDIKAIFYYISQNIQRAFERNKQSDMNLI